MSEPPGAPSAALGIEAVEWFSHGDEDLTVRVTGRWRRRRPALSGQPLLVIEVDGQRHRFPAMPEPPGLTGAAPGTWQLSFTVPTTLTAQEIELAWLQMGSVLVPLPVAVQTDEPVPQREGRAAAGVHPGAPAADPGLVLERRLRSSELALQATRMRATQAEQGVAELAARVEELERELDRLRAEPARLQSLLVQRDAARRAAEQRAHAERALRAELHEELAQRRREDDDADATLEELALARARMAELEASIAQLRRQSDEAEHIAAAASAARERAEGALAEQMGRTRAEARVPREEARRMSKMQVQIAVEAGLVQRLILDTIVPVRYGAPRSAPLQALAAERRLVGLRRQAEPRRRPTRPAAVGPAAEFTAAPARALTATLAALRTEILELGALSAAERARRRGAQSRARELERQVNEYAARCAGAYEAIEQLRAQLELLRPAIASSAAASAGPQHVRSRAASIRPRAAEGRRPLDPARLDVALSRLRESAEADAAAQAADEADTAALRSAPARAGSPTRWLGRAFVSLAGRDPAAAGRLLLALLPAQGRASPRPLAYDLVIEGLGCVQVSVEGPLHDTAVELADTPRPLSTVQFALSGDLASIAAAVATGSLHRRLRRRRVRVRGQRRAADALVDLVQAPVTVAGLLAAGARVDPWLALTLVSLMIDPAWTRGERFAVAFQEPSDVSPRAQLQVRDGTRPTVSEVSLGLDPETTVACAGDRLLAVLDGDIGGAVQVRGETRPLALLQRWVERAQSG